MKPIARLNFQLTPEQHKAMEEVYLKRDMTLDSFKLLKQDYADVKTKVKKIEKKLMNLIEQEGPDAFTCKCIEWQITHIENKYKAIDYAIKHYHAAIKLFNDDITSPHFRNFSMPETYDSPLRRLKGYLGNADVRIDEALNAIRITGRYFKNISGMFKSHAQLKVAMKERDIRLKLIAAKAAAESLPPAQEENL